MGDFSGWSCDCESGYPAGADLGREAGEVPVMDTEVGGRGEKTLQPPSPLVLQPAPDTGHPEAIRNEAVCTMTYVATYDKEQGREVWVQQGTRKWREFEGNSIISTSQG